jgi:4-hydroxythreonine-4-phosphate dehydrogenase
MEKNKTVLGITHGDFNGVSYEIILKTFADNEMLELATPVIYGSSKAAAFYKKLLDLQNLNLNIINNIQDLRPKRLNIINCGSEDVTVTPGVSTPEAGKAAFQSLEKATEDLKNKRIDALVTAPINKKNIQSDLFHFPGHTEYLEKKFGTPASSLMLLINDAMRVAVVTGHLAVENISKTLTEELILKKLQILNDTLKRDFLIVRPRIALLGLNPHAGDEGVMGNEEKNIISPAIKKAVEKGIFCIGPYPADGFFGAEKYKNFDGVLAMYHDQGLIPFKTIAMESGVNYTAGLPIVRTSPDHGTAYDLAGKNAASEESFRHACFAAVDILNNRRGSAKMSLNPLHIELRQEQGGKIQ